MIWSGEPVAQARPVRTPEGVFVLDDHELVRTGLQGLLRSAGIDVAGSSGSAREAARRIPALMPALAVLDDQLPDGTGAEVCRAVLAVDPRIRCVIITDEHDEAALIGAVMSGAWGCLSKQDDGIETVRLVRRVLGGQTAYSPSFQAMLLEPPQAPFLEQELPGLAPQELKVLLLIGRGLAGREIAATTGLAEKTIKNMTSVLLHKLGVSNRTQAALLVTRELDRSAEIHRRLRPGQPEGSTEAVTMVLLDCVDETDGPLSEGSESAELTQRLGRALDDARTVPHTSISQHASGGPQT
jgi:DNA-binding NarL/FixJ family response regulator